MDTVIDDNKYKYFTRKTKIVCTAGPACWDEVSKPRPITMYKSGCQMPLPILSPSQTWFSLIVTSNWLAKTSPSSLNNASWVSSQNTSAMPMTVVAD